MDNRIKKGDYACMGVRTDGKNVIFTFQGERDKKCAVLLYDKETGELAERIDVPKEFSIGSLRSVCVEGIDTSAYNYLYEVDGRPVMDPYACNVVGRENWADPMRQVDNQFIKCAIDRKAFDWKEDKNPEIAKENMCMYKLHVRGFSMEKSSKKKGTFQYITDSISYFKELGVNVLEMMPVYEFEERVTTPKTKLQSYSEWKSTHEADERKTGSDKTDQMFLKPGVSEPIKLNYWGYTMGNYFAPKTAYASSKHPTDELKELIRTLHENEMECILEFYFPEETNQNLIIDALRFWVMEYHVDGFHLLGSCVPIANIVQDLMLSRTKIFYVGFEERFMEDKEHYPHLYPYNDEFLYPIRRVLNATEPSLYDFANQMKKQHMLQGYVNYIVDNNGFTLMDLFSYCEKHNEENGEGNRDGSDWNYSSNCGIEGTTRKKFIIQQRKKQVKNALAILYLAQGIPLLSAGDELGNSQNGNNNVYCQDNSIGWVNWKQKKKNEDIYAFAQKMIAFRKEHPVISAAKPMKMTDYENSGYPDLSYHGKSAWLLGFEVGRLTLGMLYGGAYQNRDGHGKAEDVYVAYNFHYGEQTLALPELEGKKRWRLVMNTAEETECFYAEEKRVEENSIRIQGQSICILLGK